MLYPTQSLEWAIKAFGPLQIERDDGSEYGIWTIDATGAFLGDCIGVGKSLKEAIESIELPCIPDCVEIPPSPKQSDAQHVARVKQLFRGAHKDPDDPLLP